MHCVESPETNKQGPLTVNKNAKARKASFKQTVLECNLQAYHVPYTKINSKLTTDPNVTTRAIKLTEENTIHPHDLVLGNNLGYKIRSTGDKRIDQTL